MRSAVLLALLLATTGCTSTHSIYRSEPGDIELLNERMQGHRATVELTDGTREDGTVLFVRADSTAWHNTVLRRSVRTDDVARMTRHWKGNWFQNSLKIGGGLGVAIAIPVLLEGDSFLWDAETVAFTFVGTGLAYGALIGSIASRRRTYVLKEAPPTGLNY